MRLLRPVLLAALQLAQLAQAPQLGSSSSQVLSQLGTDAELKALCRSIVPGWGLAEPSKLRVINVVQQPAGAAAGLGDRLWRVNADARWCGVARDSEVCSVLVRRFAAGSELLIDRAVEAAVVSALARQGWDEAVRVGSFSNGRIDTWPEGWAAVPDEQARDPLVLNAVAVQLALLHRQTPRVPGLSFQTGLASDSVQPVLWGNLRRLLELAESVTFPEGADGRAHLLRSIGLSGISAAIDRLEQRWKKLRGSGNSAQAVRFSHNNLGARGRSIMIRADMIQTDADWPRIVISEFAHADYNFCAFDIAEYFKSLAGPGCDWKNLPTPAVQKAWIARYLASSAERNAAYTMAAAESLYKEVQLLGLASHLSRCLLSVLNAAATEQRQSEAEQEAGATESSTSGSSGDDEGYDWLGYASQRMERFRVERPRVLAELAGKKKKHKDL